MSAPSRVRLAPATRREQLLDLGVRLLSTRSLDEISIEMLAEEAGISRGLLYHYFGNKQDFHRAVVRRAADDLIRITAPVPDGDPVEVLELSLVAYADYVQANYAGYLSLVRGAAGGNESLRAIYEESRAALTDRIFDTAGPSGLEQLGVTDSPQVRLLARGWAAMVEDVVVSWVADDRGIPRRDLLASLAAALPPILAGGDR